MYSMDGFDMEALNRQFFESAAFSEFQAGVVFEPGSGGSSPAHLDQENTYLMFDGDSGGSSPSHNDQENTVDTLRLAIGYISFLAELVASDRAPDPHLHPPNHNDANRKVIVRSSRMSVDSVPHSLTWSHVRPHVI
ncbi:hypothetical protein OTU49_000690, partial [Cherax quadricarinatus]